MTSTSAKANLRVQAETSATPAAAQASAASAGTNQPTSGHSSYASAIRHTQIPDASESSKMSIAVGAPPVAQHGHSESVNGRTQTIPAVPAPGGPTIVNGSNNDHTRKPSMTVTPAGATSFGANGGPVGGTQNKVNNIQFGALSAGSPAPSNTPSLANQSASLGVGSLNPRVISPQNSPSPIPQPVSVSGGRPPSSLQGQGNGVSFGNLESNDPTSVLRGPMHNMHIGGPQNDHTRRNSSQSIQSDMSNTGMPTGPGRGNYSNHAGRGRGYHQGSYQQPQPQMPYSPSPSFRPPPGGRGMQQGYQNRPQGQYAGSPSLGSRSPSFAGATPGTPQMNQQMYIMPGTMPGQQAGYPYMGPQQVNRHFPSPYDDSFKGRGGSIRARARGARTDRGDHRGRGKGFGRGSREDGLVYSNDPASERYRPNRFSTLPIPLLPPTDLSPETGNFEQFLTQRTQGYPGLQVQSDPSLLAFQQQQWMQQQTQFQGYAQPPPQSPRPPYSRPPNAPYMQQSYSGQGQPQTMVRQHSGISIPDRPGSSIGQSHAPSMGPAPTTSQIGHAPSTPASTFSKPPRKSAALQIKNAQGDVITFTKPSASPSPAVPSPAKTATPPIPTTSSTPAPDATHNRAESVSVKVEDEKKKALDAAEKKKAMQDAIARKIADDEAKAKAIKEDAEPEKKAPEMEEEPKPAEIPVVEVPKTNAPITEAVKEVEAQPAKAEEKVVTPEPEKIETSKELESAATKPVEDEFDFEAYEREMAEVEAEEARKEAEYQEKKKAKLEAQKKKEAEEEAEYEATMKQKEREAEEREAELERKKVEGTSDDETAKRMFNALKSEDPDSTPALTDSPAVATPVESGAATPVSDASMPPPARGASSTKRAKAPDLVLDLKKAVEPPEPSATMKSLKSARMLADPTIVEYPSGIASPNPALNANAPADRKFKYNKEFLLQFQSVFKEKPSIDWDIKIREALGDGGDTSARGSSTRTPSGIGPRNMSNKPATGNAFTMGAFNAGAPRVGPAQLPAGTTSEQRFAMSNAAARNPMAANPFAFGRPPAVGTPMGRSSSNNPLIPQSPRVGGGSSRGGSRAESKRNRGGNSKQTAEENRSMPLTAGMDLGAITTSAGGWKPLSIGKSMVSGPALGGDGHLAPDVVQRKVKAALNKMTPEKFDKISDQILEIAAQSKDETDGRTLRQVIQLTFEKATDEAHWAPMYAMFCQRMLQSMSPDIKDENIKDKAGNTVTGGNLFRKYLLNRCQEEFERGWKVNLPDRPEGQTEEAAMLSDEYYIAAAAKRRGLGLVKFIGELFKLSMLTERIMHECVKKLLDYDGLPDEAEVESLTSLLRTIGSNLDEPTSKGQVRMNAYFDRIKQVMDMPELPSRLRYMLLDIIDLRSAHWHSKEDNKGPKTITEIHIEAQRAQQAAEAQRLASQANNRGGRFPPGRGDARNFSGGYGAIPPPDNSGRVATEDLKRLNNRRNPSNIGASGGMGPTSLLSGRTNSGRRGLGPGGSLLTRGDDSATSSRTGTPPQREKEKKDESSMNAFSALAALEGHEGPASPPSTHSSPPAQKSRPEIERARSKSPEKSTE